MSLTTIVLPLLLAGQEANFMQPAKYLALSSRPDPLAIGGYGTGGELPKPFANLRSWKGGLGPRLRPGPDGSLIVEIINSGMPDDWLPAADSNLQVFLEAIDPRGKWSPIEFHSQITCGNSRHQVFFPANSHWSFKVNLPTGDFATKVRVAFNTGEHWLRAGEIDCKIPRTRFQLPPSVSSQAELTMVAGLPVALFRLH